MKVQVKVVVQLAAKTAQQNATQSFQLLVSPEDTVASVKERVAAVEPLPFPDQHVLVFDGKELGDEARHLAECGVVEGSSLDLVVRASEAALARQLEELLQAKALAPNELSLLYSHKYGLTVTQALKTLGLGDEQLVAFVQRQKRLHLKNGVVEAMAQGEVDSGARTEPSELAKAAFEVRITVTLKHPSRLDEVIATSVMVKPADTVLSLKERIMAAELLPLPGALLSLAGKNLNDQQRLEDAGITMGSHVDLSVRASERVFTRQLVDLVQGRILSVKELGDLYCCRSGASVHQALDVCGNGEKFKDFLNRQTCFSMGGGAVSRSSGFKEQQLPAVVGFYTKHPKESYLELHAKICSAAFCEKAASEASRIVDAFSGSTFLNIQ